MNRQVILKLLTVTLLVTVIGWVILYRDQLDPLVLQDWLDQQGALAPFVFMLIYALGTVLFFPGVALTLAGGALFGPIAGSFINLTGATLGAGLAFLLARYLAADWVANKAGDRLQKLVDGVVAEGWRFVAFTRLVPLFPFNVLNYAFGLTRIGFWPYLLTSYISMLPGAVAYTYLGYAGKEAVAGGEGLVQKLLLGLALFAVLAFLPRWVKRLKNHQLGVEK